MRTAALMMSLAVIAGCGDTHATSGTSSSSSASTGTPDDVFGGPSVCSSMTDWQPGSPTFPSGSADMYPGRVCLDCHAHPTPPYTVEGPPFVIAGTVFDTGHVPDSCNPTDAQSADLTQATVHVKDANGVVIDMYVHPSGNFYPKGLTEPVVFPVTAWVSYMGRERHMTAPAASGDCNTCHTEQGTSGAPGRIALP